MVPWSIPSLLLGLHVLQGVVVGVHFPPGSDGRASRTLDRQPDPIPGSAVMWRYLPRKRQLKPQRLLRRLGKDFDSFWMSKDLPSDILHVTTKPNTDLTLLPESKSLDLSKLAQDLYASAVTGNTTTTNNNVNGGVNGSDFLPPANLDQISRTLHSWLVSFSSCNVYYKWEDLGLLHWPRWVRKGSCSPPNDDLYFDSSSKSSMPSSTSPSAFRSCSWPPGMHCVPNRAKKLRILRWVCKPMKNTDIFRHFRESGRRRFGRRRFRGEESEESGVSEEEGEIHEEQESKTLKMPSNNREKVLHSHRVNGEGDHKPDKIDLKKILLSSYRPQRMPIGPATRPRAKRSKSGDVINTTEDWKKGKWNARRQRSHVKCRWTRIPYPVTDDCYCSC